MGGFIVNKIEVRGFDIRRSDCSKVTKKVMNTILEMILNDKNKETIKRYINKEIKKIENKEYTYEELGIPKGISKDFSKYKVVNPTIRGAKYSSRHLNLTFEVGDKPKFLYIKSVPTKYAHTNVICFFNNEDIPKGFEIDYDLMIDKIIRMKLEKLLEAIGINYNADINNKSSSLMNF